MRITTFNRALLLLFVLVALTACTQQATPTTALTVITEATDVPATVAPTTPPEATDVPPTAAPTVAPSATPVPPSGNVFTFNGVEVTLPDAIASGASGSVIPASQEEGAPEFAIHPEYTEIKLTDYPVENRYFDGMIRVYPVADYTEISKTVSQRAQAMQALLAEKPAASDEEIPMLPLYGAAQVLRTQVQYLDFANGSGVRFVTLYAQGVGPVTNQEIFYTYQGLTSDGAYWVSAILPVNASLLPADAESASNPPADGVVFPEGATDAEPYNAYYQAITDKLNAAPADQFTPDLTELDAMMQSLRVTAP